MNFRKGADGGMDKKWALLVAAFLLAALLAACREDPYSDMTYEKYNAMTGEQQYEFYQSFDTPEDFFAWYNAAKAEYLAAQETINGSNATIIIGDGQD